MNPGGGVSVGHFHPRTEERFEVPAGNLQGFLTEAAAIARAGRYTKRGIPKGPGALMEAAEFADRYRDDVVLTGDALPPPSDASSEYSRKPTLCIASGAIHTPELPGTS